MTPLYIFDLDGTLALNGKRRYLVEGPKKDWKTFFGKCVDDEPNWPVIETVIRLDESFAEIWVFSGRSISVHAQTVGWCVKHKFNYAIDRLVMRPAEDYRSDVELKQQWLDEMTQEDRERLVAVFDDRQCVVDMWRRNGIACFQVAPGDF